MAAVILGATGTALGATALGIVLNREDYPKLEHNQLVVGDSDGNTTIIPAPTADGQLLVAEDIDGTREIKWDIVGGLTANRGLDIVANAVGLADTPANTILANATGASATPQPLAVTDGSVVVNSSGVLTSLPLAQGSLLSATLGNTMTEVTIGGDQQILRSNGNSVQWSDEKVQSAGGGLTIVGGTVELANIGVNSIMANVSNVVAPPQPYLVGDQSVVVNEDGELRSFKLTEGSLMTGGVGTSIRNETIGANNTILRSNGTTFMWTPETVQKPFTVFNNAIIDSQTDLCVGLVNLATTTTFDKHVNPNVAQVTIQLGGENTTAALTSTGSFTVNLGAIKTLLNAANVQSVKGSISATLFNNTYIQFIPVVLSTAITVTDNVNWIFTVNVASVTRTNPSIINGTLFMHIVTTAAPTPP